MIALKKLALGTAQFGMRYGVANNTGQPSISTVRSILEQAEGAGVLTLDTAHTYGDSEHILGRLLGNQTQFRIITKTLPIQKDVVTKGSIEEVMDAFRRSLKRLRRGHIYGLLVHHEDDLLVPGGERLWAWMQSVHESGLTDRIGVSVYSPQTLRVVMDRYPLGIVQVPFNIYDQRFAATGLLANLKLANVEVHGRSAFLQGLLLMDANDLPSRLASIRPLQARLHNCLRENGMSPLSGALAFCLNHSHIDYVVVGCDTLKHFEDILEAAKKINGCSDLDLEQFAIGDENVVNPSRWAQPS
jgi:aryl-alcohol dehydrogenase-like predicted oxidoreductase